MNITKVKALLASPDAPGLLKETDDKGCTALHWAATKGHEAVVRLLLEKGADPKATDKGGQTPAALGY